MFEKGVGGHTRGGTTAPYTPTLAVIHTIHDKGNTTLQCNNDAVEITLTLTRTPLTHPNTLINRPYTYLLKLIRDIRTQCTRDFRLQLPFQKLCMRCCGLASVVQRRLGIA